MSCPTGCQLPKIWWWERWKSTRKTARCRRCREAYALSYDPNGIGTQIIWVPYPTPVDEVIDKYRKYLY